MADAKPKMVFAFRCSRTGLYFPSDYVENWGTKYGQGLGPKPISEALVNEYGAPVCKSTSRPDRSMHPTSPCLAQVDLVQIPVEEYLANRAILGVEDPSGELRAEVMIEKQQVKSGEMQQLYRIKGTDAKALVEKRSAAKRTAKTRAVAAGVVPDVDTQYVPW